MEIIYESEYMGSLAEIPDREDAGQTAGPQVHKETNFNIRPKFTTPGKLAIPFPKI